MMPPSTMTSIAGSPTDRYNSVATAASDSPPTRIRDGAGGITSCRSTLSGGVLRSWMSDGRAKPTSNTIALPEASTMGIGPGSGRSPLMMSASIHDRISSAAKPTTLPAATPMTPSTMSCTVATDITKPCVAPRLFIRATVSMRRCAKRRADIEMATALSSRLMTAVSDRKRLARSAAA